MRFQLATPADFFRAAANVSELPELSGEIPSSWLNVISSMSHLWPPTIVATDALLSAEKFAAINDALGYADYPQKEFESLWKTVLEAQDHNNFGQGGDPGDNRKIEYAQAAAAGAGQILRDALRNIAERVQQPFARSAPIVVFNPLNWSRDDTVRAHVSLYGDVSPGDIGDYRKALRLVDESGAAVPLYVEGYSGTVSRAVEIAFIARGVPSLGYKTYYLTPAEKPDGFPNACDLKLDDADQAKPRRILGTNQLENEFFRVTMDRATGRITVFDKDLNRTVAEDLEIAGSDIMLDSGPHFGDEIPRELWKTWRQIQDWTFVGTADWGLTICADRHLMTLGEGVIRAGMLRSSYSPVGIVRGDKPFFRQFPPAGKYVLRYSLTSGQGDWAAAKSYRAGMAFSNPLIPVCAADELSSKPLPPTRSFCSLAADNLVVTALKKAERDNVMVLRAVEMEGRRTETPVNWLQGQRGFRAVNLLEEPSRNGEEASLRMAPFEIGTLQLPAD
jgi:alpha-mannosidase